MLCLLTGIKRKQTNKKTPTLLLLKGEILEAGLIAAFLSLS